MCDPFIGEVKICAFKFAPQGWAQCNGTILQIAQNQALNALIGGIYAGGDKVKTFALPNLCGRTPVHRNYSKQDYQMGSSVGAETVTLGVGNMPAHTHDFVVTQATGTKINASPTNTAVVSEAPQNLYAADSGTITAMSSATCSAAGASAAHNNMQPSLVLNFVIATTGLWPPRN